MRKFITSDEAIELLAEGETVHTFYNFHLGLVGVDWKREEIIEKLRKSDKIEICGEVARSMGHGICAYNNNAAHSDVLFIATNMEKLDALDPEEEIDGEV